MKKRGINWKVLVSCLVIVYAVALVGGLFTSGNTNSDWYNSVKPTITPPGWVFPIVWNILYFLIALAIYFVWVAAKNKSTKKSIAILFGINLFFNAFWSYFFFGLQKPASAMVDLILIWISIIPLFILTWRIDKKSTWLLAPYFLWVTFAGVLNWAIVLKNSIVF